MTQSPLELLLARLEKVRQRHPGQYSACCPAHADKGPSLSVRETPDGSVLLHCFAGCGFNEIVSAVGLQPQDLFPPRERPSKGPRRVAGLLTPSQALELLTREAHLVAVCAGILSEGRPLSTDDRNRLMQASGRVLAIAREARNG